MRPRQRRGIYKFLKKLYPDRKKDDCLALLDSQCHYFVVLNVLDEYCEGFMFTTATTEEYENNVLLRPGDIEPGGFQFSDDTHFLTVPLKKFHYLKTGDEPIAWLSDEGEKHIRCHISREAQSWDEYVRDFCASI